MRKFGNDVRFKSKLSHLITDRLMDALRKEKWFDTLVLVHGEMTITDQSDLHDWLAQYRQLINSKLILGTILK